MNGSIVNNYSRLTLNFFGKSANALLQILAIGINSFLSEDRKTCWKRYRNLSFGVSESTCDSEVLLFPAV